MKARSVLVGFALSVAAGASVAGFYTWGADLDDQSVTEMEIALGATGAVTTVSATSLGDQSSVILHRFAPGGDTLGTWVVAEEGENPSLALAGDGSAVVVWQDSVDSVDADEVWLRRCGASTCGSAVLVGYGSRPGVDVDQEGGSLVVWEGAGSLEGTVWGRYVSGRAQTGRAWRLSTPGDTVERPTVVHAGGATFVAAWSQTTPGAPEVQAVQINAGSGPRSAPKLIGEGSDVAVDILRGHGVVALVWAGADGSGSGVFGRSGGVDLESFGSVYRVSASPVGEQDAPDVAFAEATGQPFHVWRSQDATNLLGSPIFAKGVRGTGGIGGGGGGCAAACHGFLQPSNSAPEALDETERILVEAPLERARIARNEYGDFAIAWIEADGSAHIRVATPSGGSD